MAGDLNTDLAASDAAHAQETEQQDQAIAAAQEAEATAGQELQAAEHAAEQAAGDAEQEYNQFLSTLQTCANESKAAVEAAEEPASAQDEIDAIEDVGPVVVTSNDVADIQAAIDFLIVQVNTQKGQIVAAQQKINDGLTNGAIGHLKVGANKAADALQSIRDYTPQAIDIETLISAELEGIEDLI